ncbi:MAG: phosphate ABC transporter substrate-binding protein, partial [Okeania sp. SIO2H7]|nr:phosphate ABC transporter substrate-binding protein [Okeania sp. SIO2H7]
MARPNGPPPIVFILALLLFAGGAYWFFVFRDKRSPTVTNLQSPAVPAQTAIANTFPPPVSVASGTIIRLDGSTSMVGINQNLKNAFEGQFPGTSVLTNARGSSLGIQALLTGNVDVAASSRPLTPQEQSQGLQAVPVTLDKIAIVVGVNNPFNGGLTLEQVRAIFQGDITNWSEVGGPNSLIRVINRPTVSGTHQMFKEMVLDGGNFGNSFNISTMERDATTPMLRALGNDGIGYATYAQVENQQTERSHRLLIFHLSVSRITNS